MSFSLYQITDDSELEPLLVYLAKGELRYSRVVLSAHLFAVFMQLAPKLGEIDHEATELPDGETVGGFRVQVNEMLGDFEVRAYP